MVRSKAIRSGFVFAPEHYLTLKTPTTRASTGREKTADNGVCLVEAFEPSSIQTCHRQKFKNEWRELKRNWRFVRQKLSGWFIKSVGVGYMAY